MSKSIETNKYIEKLVKIITQKEKMIDQLRRSAKISEQQSSNMLNDQTSILGLKVRQDLTINNLQIKSLQQKMSDMEKRLFDFSQGLKEQSQINEQLRLKIQSYEKRQKELSGQIADLQESNHRLKQKIAELDFERSQEQAKRGFLELEVKQLTKKLKQYQLNQKFETKQTQKQLKIIQEKVKSLYRMVNETAFSEIKEQDCVLQNQKKSIIKMIDLIEQKLKKQNEYPQQDVLNDTFDGISMIVRSLECGYSVFEPKKLSKNCSYGPTNILKNEGSVSETVKQQKCQSLKKSKLQSTRLNCTTKILQDFLSQ